MASALICVAGEAIAGGESQMVFETGAAIGEQRFENPARGEDGGAGIDCDAAAIDGAQLAAGGRHALDDGDGHPARREQRCCSQPADAGTDDDDALAFGIARQTLQLPFKSRSVQKRPRQ